MSCECGAYKHESVWCERPTCGWNKWNRLRNAAQAVVDKYPIATDLGGSIAKLRDVLNENPSTGE